MHPFRKNHIAPKPNRALISAASACALLIAIVIIVSGCGARKTGEVTIRIEPGSSTAQIARQLVAEDVIDSEKDFINAADDAGVGDQLKAGLYRFERGEPVPGILDKLKNGLQAPEAAITIPEGYDIADIARLAATKTSFSEKDYTKAAGVSGRPLPLFGAANAEDLEGFLFPSTYDLDEGMTAGALVDSQLAEFSNKTAGLDWKRADRLGVTPYQALIIASMVEREAKVPEERPLVAAVIYNRLGIGMKLEVDATVQYAVGSWKADLTQQDLETDSPYNTRLYKGLPPGPICNPGLESIKAALAPADVDYIYYVATGDAAGHHYFTSSYEDFLRASGG